MGLLVAHAVHGVLLLGGLVVTVWLLEPALTQRRRVRTLRRAVADGRLVEVVNRRAAQRLAATEPRRRLVTALDAYTFGVVQASCVVLTLLVAGVRGRDLLAPSAATFGAGAVVGLVLLRRARRPLVAALVAAVTQYAAHALAAVVTTPDGRSGLSVAVFFCHRVGVAPSGAQLAAVSRYTAGNGSAAAGVSPLVVLVLVVTIAAAALVTVGTGGRYWDRTSDRSGVNRVLSR